MNDSKTISCRLPSYTGGSFRRPLCNSCWSCSVNVAGTTIISHPGKVVLPLRLIAGKYPGQPVTKTLYQTGCHLRSVPSLLQYCCRVPALHLLPTTIGCQQYYRV